MTGADQGEVQLVALMERYCQLGRLLPKAEDIDFDDVAKIAEIKTVLSEMEATKLGIDRYLAKHPLFSFPSKGPIGLPE